MARVKWTIHPIANTDEGDGPLFAVIPDDETRGLVVGELTDVNTLTQVLARLIESNEHDGEIGHCHEQLGYNWITAGQAEARYGVPRASITWACRRGLIADVRKRGNLWEFPEVTFRYWMNNRPRS